MKNYFDHDCKSIYRRFSVNQKINFKKWFENNTGFYFRYDFCNANQKERFLKVAKSFL